MDRSIRHGVLLLPLLFAVGCGGEEEAPTAIATPTAQGGTSGNGSTEVEVTSTQLDLDDEASDEEYVAPFPENLDLFAPPKDITFVEPEPEPDPMEELHRETMPTIRVMGFVNVEGMRAIVTVDGEKLIVGAGDELDNVEVVEVTYPMVRVQQGDYEMAINMFDQAWGNREGSSASFVPASRSGKRGTRRSPAATGAGRTPRPSANPARVPEEPEATPEASKPALPSLPSFPAFRGPPTVAPETS